MEEVEGLIDDIIIIILIYGYELWYDL